MFLQKNSKNIQYHQKITKEVKIVFKNNQIIKITQMKYDNREKKINK